MPDATPTLTLDSPLKLRSGRVLKNRIAKAALSEQLGDLSGAPTAHLDRLYRRWSDGQFGLVLTGNVMIDRRAIGEARNVVVEDRRHMGQLRSWAAASTAAGNEAWVQINHPGRQTPKMLSPHPVAPSPIQLQISGQFAKPRALTGDEIQEMITRFAETAKICIDAGFTGVQIHGAHGYLVSQFLSPRSNQRTDEWGGDPQRRMRFLLEVVRAVRAAIGPEAGLGVKLNSADFQRGGFTEEESMGVVERLGEEAVDLLEISGGTYEQAAMMGAAKQQKESTRQREAYFLEYAEQVRQRTDLPLMLTGGLRSRGAIDEALTSGAVDVIGLGRPAVLQTDLAAVLLADPSARANDVRDLGVGVKLLSDISNLAWYTTQLWRIGAGHEPAPQRHPAAGTAHYLGKLVSDAAVRKLRRAPSYR